MTAGADDELYAERRYDLLNASKDYAA